MKRKFLLIMLLLLGIGFAAVSTTLLITGNVNISTYNEDFDVVFTKAVTEEYASTATITDSGKKITFGTKDLVNVNDIARLDYEVTNNSTMYDAVVSVLCSVSENNSTYYEISSSGEMEIAGKAKGTGNVQVKLKKASVEDREGTFTCTLTATAKERTIKATLSPFTTDSWATITEKVKSGTYPYQVGDTKEVNLGETLGTHILRVANTSPCNGEASKTACGFVLEFADIITRHSMNSNGGDYGTNVGGWPATPMREYVNNDIYNALPSDLKVAIIDTTVVSGHGNNAGETNFTSTDKLYLLSTKEVWGTPHGSDTVNSETRQLDYYKNNGVTNSNYRGAIKQYNGRNYWWWLRSARSSETNSFFDVRSDATRGSDSAYEAHGVSPAFRIA